MCLVAGMICGGRGPIGWRGTGSTVNVNELHPRTFTTEVFCTCVLTDETDDGACICFVELALVVGLCRGL